MSTLCVQLPRIHNATEKQRHHLHHYICGKVNAFGISNSVLYSQLAHQIIQSDRKTKVTFGMKVLRCLLSNKQEKTTFLAMYIVR